MIQVKSSASQETSIRHARRPLGDVSEVAEDENLKGLAAAAAADDDDDDDDDNDELPTFEVP